MTNAHKRRVLEDDALDNLGNDDDILVDGGTLRVPMLMMDSLSPVQIAIRDASPGAFGAAPGGTAVRASITSPDPGVGGYRASVGGDKPDGGTSTVTRKADPARAYAEYIARIEGAWRGSPPEYK